MYVILWMKIQAKRQVKNKSQMGEFPKPGRGSGESATKKDKCNLKGKQSSEEAPNLKKRIIWDK